VFHTHIAKACFQMLLQIYKQEQSSASYYSLHTSI
jgi:hypothetical protein